MVLVLFGEAVLAVVDAVTLAVEVATLVVEVVTPATDEGVILPTAMALEPDY